MSEILISDHINQTLALFRTHRRASPGGRAASYTPAGACQHPPDLAVLGRHELQVSLMDLKLLGRGKRQNIIVISDLAIFWSAKVVELRTIISQASPPKYSCWFVLSDHLTGSSPCSMQEVKWVLLLHRVLLCYTWDQRLKVSMADSDGS